ncbi:MAG: acyl-CoA thioesterase [Oscillospiraceae bacterium]|nr:acyl-CoA thioesterase [Oscillospiraceae bacterium]
MTRPYIHKVHYHETDRMGITHHSNYIRWMEEARVDYLDQVGYGYARMEREGILSPVIGIECQYKHATTFDDEVAIRVEAAEFRGVRLVIRYEMTRVSDGALVLTGKSTHCFTTPEGKPIILKKRFPELDQLLRSMVVPKDQ